MSLPDAPIISVSKWEKWSYATLWVWAHKPNWQAPLISESSHWLRNELTWSTPPISGKVNYNRYLPTFSFWPHPDGKFYLLGSWSRSSAGGRMRASGRRKDSMHFRVSIIFHRFWFFKFQIWILASSFFFCLLEVFLVTHKHFKMCLLRLYSTSGKLPTNTWEWGAAQRNSSQRRFLKIRCFNGKDRGLCASASCLSGYDPCPHYFIWTL